jgi:hypothetical protein
MVDISDVVDIRVSNESPSRSTIAPALRMPPDLVAENDHDPVFGSPDDNVISVSQFANSDMKCDFVFLSYWENIQ